MKRLSKKREKHMKRGFVSFIAFMLCICMVTGFSVSAFAEGADIGDQVSEESTQEIAETPSEEPSTDSEVAEGVDTDKLEVPETSVQPYNTPSAESSKVVEVIEEEIEENIPLEQIETTRQKLSLPMEDGTEILVEGNLPTGAYIRATEVVSIVIEDAIKREVGSALATYLAYDILIYDVNGKEIQPEENMRVTISASEFSTGTTGGEIGICYINNEQTEANTVAVGTNSAVVEHFSIYAIYELNTDSYTVTFHIDDGTDGTTEKTIIDTVATGNLCPEPAPPIPPAGKAFVGWSSDKDTKTLFDLETTRIITGTELWAWFEPSITTQVELESALRNAENGDIITLTQDIEISGSPLVVSGNGKTFTLKGNGYSLKLAPGYSGLHMRINGGSNAGNITITDLNIIGHNNGTPTADNYDLRISGGGLDLRGSTGNKMTYTLNNVGFTGNHQMEYGVAASVYVYFCTLTLNGCTFTNNSGTTGGAICYVDGRINAANCTFRNNYGSYHGGAIGSGYGNKVTIMLNNSSFIGNVSAYDGGAIDVGEGHTFIATNCIFSDNIAGRRGGVFRGGTTGTVTLNDCTVKNNSAGNSGGAFTAPNVIAENTNFIGNKSGNQGGALSIVNGRGLKITGGSFVNNHAVGSGGAIANARVCNSATMIDSTKFNGNTSDAGYMYSQLFSDTAAPIDAIGRSTTGASLSKQAAISNPTSQYYYGNYYTNIDGASAGPHGYTSDNILNVYDLSAGYYYITILLGDAEDAYFSEPSNPLHTGKAVYSYSGYLNDVYQKSFVNAGYEVKRDGYVLIGWRNDETQVAGWSETEETLVLDTYIRGDMYLTPVWAKEVNLTYHLNAGTAKGDEGNPYASGSMVTVKELTEVDDTWVAPDGSTFIGWATDPKATDPEYKAGALLKIEDDTELYAVWKVEEEPIMLYTVVYEPGDHGIFGTQTTTNLRAGVTTPMAPTVAGEDGWRFTGWSPVPTETVTGNAVYVAQWETISMVTPSPTPTPMPTPDPVPPQDSTPNPDMAVPAEPTTPPKPITYTVKYLPGEHGTFIPQETNNLRSGAETPSAPVITGEAGWIFSGWTPTLSATVTGNATYTARWTRVTTSPVNTNTMFTVRFVDWNGTILKTQQVQRGGNAAPPANPVREGYTFSGWDRSYTNVAESITVTAQYIVNEPRNADTVNDTPSGGNKNNDTNIDDGVPGGSVTDGNDNARYTITSNSSREEVLQALVEGEGIETITIGDMQVPLSAGPFTQFVWALVNLILAASGIVLAVVTSIRTLKKRKYECDEQYMNADGKTQHRRRPMWIIAAIIMGIAGIIVFLLTEDMNRLMVLVDDWTIVNALILAAEIVGIKLSFKREKESRLIKYETDMTQQI